MDFYNQVQWNDDLTPYLEGLDFDAAAFAAALDEVVVQPIIKAQEILDSMPYMTRIFTTISPEEMDRDPFLSTHPTWRCEQYPHSRREPEFVNPARTET